MRVVDDRKPRNDRAPLRPEGTAGLRSANVETPSADRE
jgi:hypothetical protein